MLGFDTETLPITEQEKAPPLVCLSWYDTSLQTGGVLPPSSGIDFLLDQLSRGRKAVAHNAAFDLAVIANARPGAIPALFAALDNGQIECTLMRERLMRLAQGRLNRPRVVLAGGAVGADTLAGCAFVHLGVDLSLGKGEDSWRLRFGELRHLDTADWPRAARAYALEDAMWVARVAERQCYSTIESELHDAAARTRAAFSLHLLSARGIAVDMGAVDRLEEEASAIVDAADGSLDVLGLGRGGKKVVAAQEAMVEYWFGHEGANSERPWSRGDEPPQTEKGSTRTDRQTIVGLDYEALVQVEMAGPWRTVLQTFVPALKRAVDGVIHCSYQPLVSTGRVSCRRPNLTNIPRSHGVRECLRPRDGYVFVACDYDSAELRTLGQVLLDRFGESALADAFRSDPSFDPHLAFAERLTSSRDAAELKIWRQRAKAANFGFPGGLGVRAFLAYALGYGVRLSLAQAEDIREGWFEQWPQMKDYFSINGRRARASCSRVVHERSCRIRADCTFTQLCNTPFQGMTADAALHALWEVTKRCYGDSSSSLFGSRPVIFVHDEIVVEVPESRVDDVVRELPKVMTEAARRFVPDVPMTCKATAQRLWSKDAQHVEDAFGRVVPWVKTDSTPLLIRPGMV